MGDSLVHANLYIQPGGSETCGAIIDMTRQGGGNVGPMHDDENSDVEISRANITLPEEQLYDPTFDVPPTEAELGTPAGNSASSAPWINPLLAMTQQQLQSACKRVGQSSSVAKPVLAWRLLQAGVSDAAAVWTLAYEFNTTKRG